MYNLLNISVILQQAKKKPLVTEILPESSYTRGWRCRVDYGRSLISGQVYSKYHRHKCNGEWRWFLSAPRKTRNCIQPYVLELQGRGRCHSPLIRHARLLERLSPGVMARLNK
jgi:hypothetical protein